MWGRFRKIHEQIDVMFKKETYYFIMLYAKGRCTIIKNIFRKSKRIYRTESGDWNKRFTTEELEKLWESIRRNQHTWKERTKEIFEKLIHKRTVKVENYLVEPKEATEPNQFNQSQHFESISRRQGWKNT